MGNRFKDMAGYHAIIIAHGVIATIVFLGIVPTSAIIIRYYSRWNPYWAFKLHAWCQVLTLLLTTVVFVLGWFAVGPARSLTNPHHGIGLAIYVIVIFQVLFGWFLHKKESKRQRTHVPLKLVVSDYRDTRDGCNVLTCYSYTGGWVVLLLFLVSFKFL